MKKLIIVISIITIMGFFSLNIFAQDVKKEEKKEVKTEVKADTGGFVVTDEIAKETEEKCVATEKDPITLKDVKSKVEEAAAIIEKEGDKAFPKFAGKDSKFIFGGQYIFIHDPEKSKCLFHPIKPKLIGQDLSGLKDAKGKFFFVEMMKIGKEKGKGWLEYAWPKPGTKDSIPKVTYLKVVKNGGQSYLIGCGMNNKTLEDVKKELGE